MNALEIIVDISAAGLLFCTFLMLGKIRLIPMVRHFALASLFLAIMAAAAALLRGEKDFYSVATATILFKVIFIPFIIYFFSKKIPAANQLRMYVRPTVTFFLFAAILIVSAIIVQNFPAVMENETQNSFFFRNLLFISLSLILSGILITVVRRDLFSQVLGLLTLENGIAAFGIVVLEGMPIFLEMGIFFVIILSTVILAMLIDLVHMEYPTGDTAELNELID